MEGAAVLCQGANDMAVLVTSGA